MSNKLTFDEWLNSYAGCDCNEECLVQAWNFCESQYKAEVEGLKTKFSEATKTYTDDIDRLEKENESLKKKLEKAEEVIKFYADRMNWKQNDDNTDNDIIDYCDLDNGYHGGKLARAYFKGSQDGTNDKV